MEGQGRQHPQMRRVAVGALAPRRRRPEVYRRRRLSLLAALSVVLVVPWCASRSGNDGKSAANAAPADQAAVVDCRSAAADLPLRARLSLTLMVGVDGDAPASATALLGGDQRPGGLFVRGGTAIWDDQVLATPPADGLPLLVAVDDEGGRVQPMQGLLDDLPSAAELAARTPAELTELAAERGRRLRALGINVVLGPVVDVGQAGGIGDRSFADSAEVVTAAAGAYARGLRQAGVLPVLKHFPGQGHADADTHEAAASVPPLDLLRTSDLLPTTLC